MANGAGVSRQSLINWFGAQALETQAAVLTKLSELHTGKQKRVQELKAELASLTVGEASNGAGKPRRGRPRKVDRAVKSAPAKRRAKVQPKYRDKDGNTWAGRGVYPVWLRERIKKGAKLEQFLIKT